MNVDMLKAVLISVLVALLTSYVTTYTVIYSNYDKIKELQQIRDSLKNEMTVLEKKMQNLQNKQNPHKP